MTVQFVQCPDFCAFKKELQSSYSSILTAVHVNIRSMRKYWDQFLLIVANLGDCVDVYVLTETNTPETALKTFTINGFNEFFFTRPTGSGGGIGVFIRQSWITTKVPVHFSHAESMAFEINKSDYMVSLLAVYRPPSGNVPAFLDELGDFLNTTSTIKSICIIGDLNIDTLKDYVPSVCDYMNLLANFGIENTILAPTREEIVKDKLVTSCIDHINVRAPDLNAVKAFVITHKLADHYFVGVRIYSSENRQSHISESRLVNILKRSLFNNLVSSYDWESLIREEHPSALYPKVVSLINSLKESSTVTVRVKKRRSEQVWLNDHILEAIRNKELLWKRSRRAPGNEVLKAEFKSSRNRVNALIRSAKRHHYTQKLYNARFNSGETWSIINELRGVARKSISDLLEKSFGFNLATTANSFVQHFATSACDSPGDDIFNAYDTNITQSSAFLPTLSRAELRSILFAFKRNKSPGIDGISTIDLCDNFDALANVLVAMINGFIHSGCLPEDLKTAIIVPIHKGGPRNLLSSYRPISILPCVSQILEKHLFASMTSFLDKHGIISSSQYGFVPGRGTSSLLNVFSDFLFSSFDNHSCVCALFLDVAKAFDSVNHKILLKKLYRVGFRGPFFTLLHDFLRSRSQMVSLGSVRSNKVPLHSGVPQGSVLSPLLFNIYVNDLPAVVTGNILQYADDTLLFTSHIDIAPAIHMLQADAIAVMDWFKENRISVNSSKTKLICFRSPWKKFTVYPQLFLHKSNCAPCSCLPVQYVNSIKYLGIFFDFDLTWNTHMSFIAKRLRSVSCQLYNLKMFLPFATRKLLMHSLAYSVLRYGITLFFNCSLQWHARIDCVLKGMLKSVSYNLSMCSSDNLFASLQLPCFYSLFLQTTIQHHFWNSDFKIHRIAPRTSRCKTRYEVPRIYSRYGESIRTFYVPRIFNALPDSILLSKSRRQLKRNVKRLFNDRNKRSKI